MSRYLSRPPSSRLKFWTYTGLICGFLVISVACKAPATQRKQTVATTYRIVSVKPAATEQAPGIRVRYPALRGLKDRAFQKEVNRRLAHPFLSDLLGYRHAYRGSTKDMRPNFRLDYSYRVVLQTEELLSIQISRYTFQGGAHGLGTTITFTFDLKTRKQLRLADLFKPGSAYLKHIARLVRPRLKKLVWTRGIRPVKSNYRTWTVTPQGLVVHFQVYQIAPYTHGPSEATIRWTELSQLLQARYAALLIR